MNTQEWLAKATSRTLDKYFHAIGGIGADGFRMHISENATLVDGEPVSDTFFKVIENIVAEGPKFLFCANKKYITDALAGMESDKVLFFSSGSEKAIVIQEFDSRTAAIVMPMYLTSEEKERAMDLPKRPILVHMDGGYG